MSPKISIVMPAYNAQAHIGQALESLISQTFPDWECVVVDDGSTDATLPILQEYALREPRIKYHTLPENTGSAKVPRDTAVAMASSDRIFGLDADDWLAPDTLEKLLARQEETQADAVLLRLVFVNENGHLTSKQVPSNDFDFSQEMTGLEATKLTIGEWTIAGNGLFCKGLYDLHHPIQNYMNADEYDTRRRLIAAKRVAFVDAHYYYRQTANSVTHAYHPKLFDTLHTNRLLCELIEKTYPNGDEVVKTMHLQYLHDIVDKRLSLLKNRRRWSREDRKAMRKLVRENYTNIKSIYPSALRRFFLVSRYTLRKVYYFVTS